ncbi:hypothetical protein V6N11_049992 [Hibiscus sabdariffa]|uniref:Uncharacterized protein n=2 Tax=Hibiscus sabdariffa TaxID=183260 RepID=A0ABR2T8J4_9ROSI
MLMRIHELQGNVDNFDEDSRAVSRNSSPYQEMLKNVDEDSQAASRNSSLYQEMLIMLMRIHELQVKTLRSTKKY